MAFDVGRPFDTSQVSPTDAAITLRSLRRRFGKALLLGSDDGGAEAVVHRRPSSGGLPAVVHAAWTATAIESLDAALRRVEVGPDPLIELPPVSVDPPLAGGELSAEAVVARVGDAAEAMADTIGNIHGMDWERIGHTPAGPVSALDIAHLAVRIAIEHLRAAEATVAQLTRPPR